MAFRKTLVSEADIVIVGGATKKQYPKGFEYMAHQHTYKVVDSFVSDNTEWRRLRLDDGTLEDVTTATIDADLETAAPYSKIGGKKGTVKAWEGSPNKAVILFDPDAPEEEEVAEAAPEAPVKVVRAAAKKPVKKAVKAKPKKRKK